MKTKTRVWIIVGVLLIVVIVSNTVSALNAANNAGLGNALSNIFGGPIYKK